MPKLLRLHFVAMESPKASPPSWAAIRFIVILDVVHDLTTTYLRSHNVDQLPPAVYFTLIVMGVSGLCSSVSIAEVCIPIVLFTLSLLSCTEALSDNHHVPGVLVGGMAVFLAMKALQAFEHQSATVPLSTVVCSARQIGLSDQEILHRLASGCGRLSTKGLRLDVKDIANIIHRDDIQSMANAERINGLL